ncbi:MAG: hypothetical protein AB8B96_06150 [Lysobacterales bacterium]
MANSEKPTCLSAPADGPAALDPQVVALYTELPAVCPAPEVDRRILGQARLPAHDPAGSGRWIWPASLAASLVICTTLVTQMAKVVNPAPVAPAAVGQAADPMETQDRAFANNAPDPTVDGRTFQPAIGTVTSSQSTTVLIDQSAPPETAEFWWEQLRHHAHNADRDGFLATWEVYQNHRDNTPLPDDLQRWMADNRVPMTPPAGG